jgi:putative membrane protein
MMFIMLVFLGVIVWAAVVFIRSWQSRTPYHDHAEHVTDPERILDERFARGEIDEEEYRKRKDVFLDHK